MNNHSKRRRRKVSRPRKRAKEKARLSIIGAGRMGTVLGRALKEAGYTIAVVVTNHNRSAKDSARLIGQDTLALTAQSLMRLSNGEADRLLGSDVLLISTPDDAIVPMAKSLSEFFAGQLPRSKHDRARIALHTSGALSSHVLEPLRRIGFATGSMHPLVSIADKNSDPRSFLGGFFCIEGEQAAVTTARSISRALGGRDFQIDLGSKPLYHAAAVLTAGHVVSLFDVALEMLGECGLSSRQAQAVLLPLLKSTVANLEMGNPAQALTGTFARADVTTVRRHLEAIRSSGLEEALAAYVLLGRHSLRLAKRRIVNPEVASKIEDLLLQNPGGRAKS